MAFISTGLLLRSMPKALTETPAANHSLAANPRARPGGMAAFHSGTGTEETMCGDGRDESGAEEGRHPADVSREEIRGRRVI